MNETELISILADMLASVHVNEPILLIKPLARSGNNRTWYVETPEAKYVAKQYFRHPHDNRDRLAAEFQFLQYAYNFASDQIPEPIASHSRYDLGVYRYLPGTVITPDKLDIQDVKQAATFFVAINSADRFNRGAALPIASEACFSIAEHLALVNHRMEALVEATNDEKVLPEVRDFMALLNTRWFELQNNVLRMAEVQKIPVNDILSTEQRCLSPSDFGFHNALKTSEGQVYFIDFEYAGWDDPAKMIGDFFAQIAVPIPTEFYAFFVSTVLQPFPDAKRLAQRAHILRPVYQIKWCCIALNVFLPMHFQRRKFANPDLDEHDLKQIQLTKATHLLNSLIAL
jgi:hypothetical protein